ncbi:MAG: molybdopterin-dependent oxidoreductase [Pseudomonadota bacterium]
MSRGLTRRGFLARTAVLGAGSAAGLSWADPPTLPLTVPIWTRTQGFFPPLVGLGPNQIGGEFALPGGLSPKIPVASPGVVERLFDLGGEAYDSPIMAQKGIITDNSLFYLVAHGRVPLVNWDPQTRQPVDEHVLVVHGDVRQPTLFTMRDLMDGFETHDKIHFLECAGNSFRGYKQIGDYASHTPQLLNGLVSGTKWTGVLVRDVLDAVGVRKDTEAWVLAEGADGAGLDRSIPIHKMMTDALLAFRQNDQPLQREQGFPLRLIVPGWEGNANVKWLRRLKVGRSPFMTREEATDYADLVSVRSTPRARKSQGWHFTMVMEIKSVITSPSPGGAKIQRGEPIDLVGFAWSGRGKVRKVEVRIGDQVVMAELEPPIYDRAMTRFRVRNWIWDGFPRRIESRAHDEFGTQPTHDELVRHRGVSYFYHYNAVFPYRIQKDGTVVNDVAQA